MRDLSVLIPARNEQFLSNTIEDILSNIEGNTEIIVVLDGEWPVKPLPIHERLTVLFNPQSVGQRSAVNQAARISTAKFIMKADAHCSFDKGFDVKLMADCEMDWTVVPRMYNLHVFDWVCACGERRYQGPTKPCTSCGKAMKREMIWKKRDSRVSDFMRFDTNLRFKYWGGLKERPESQGDIADTMSLLGACWFMHRERYWDIDGLDEKHGSWGQMGTEIACKSWLSGGQLKVNKKTWFAHMFRTQGEDFGFPYPLTEEAQEHARSYSYDLWMNNKWPKAKHDIPWLIAKFHPVPDWDNQLTKGILYYTDHHVDQGIMKACQNQLDTIGLPIVSVSLQPMHFGKNLYVPLQRGYLTMAKQILAGLEALDTDIVFFAEHDVLYHPSHFEFIPSKRDLIYYNENVWKVRAEGGTALHYDCKQLSGLCAFREVLIAHFKERVRKIEAYGFSRKMGFEPGTHSRKERVDDLKSQGWNSQYPNIDIRHGNNLTPSRWRKDQFRDQRYTKGWFESETIPGWKRLDYLYTVL